MPALCRPTLKPERAHLGHRLWQGAVEGGLAAAEHHGVEQARTLTQEAEHIAPARPGRLPRGCRSGLWQ